MNSVFINAIADFLVAICSAAVIGLFAYIFRKRIFKYFADARLMRSIGITMLRKRSKFSSSELHKIFYKACSICIYYKTGKRFWERLDNEKILEKISSRNPNLKIRVLLANAESKQSVSISEAERSFGTRDDSEEDIITEISAVRELFSKYSFIEWKTDPDLFFLPYVVVEYKKNNTIKKTCYLGLNIIPVRSPNSLQIVAEKKEKDDYDTEDNIDMNNIKDAGLVDQLSIHFDTAWQLAEGNNPKFVTIQTKGDKING